MKSKLLILCLFVVTGSALGQNYTFKVLANKGENKVKSGAEWQQLKTGASLSAQDELSLSDNAYLGLVHASGKTLEVKKSGTYKVSELAKKVNTGTSSVASKYADFVLSKISEGKKNRLNATGAVHRGEQDDITVYMPSSVSVYNDEAIIRWDSAKTDVQKYIVTLTNMFEDTLYSIETEDSKINLDLTQDKIAKENVVLLTVAGADAKKSGTYAIKKLPKPDAEKVKNTLDELMSDVNEETALNKYILAGFYEENNLLVDALTNYEKAVELAPDVESYKEAYEDFILRNRLGQ